ncbi:unnamed protein product [Clonostachys rhizophaga]|uniref:Zn(2)-C6 fungal-type domain-containing protein n=1 Tax=Clonostachys rhizophaga TaxID=160324 RepID=A0A9N9VUS3_9HYPO|nr:unnamed protein product [Clonostachys rhizophaga]
MGGTKRSSASEAHEASKRRAPYAPRACDACRRRKGRCNGQKPCGYCLGRVMECCYSHNPEERRSNAAQNNQDAQDQAPKPADWAPNAIQSLTDLVATLQGQLNAIAAHTNVFPAGNGSLDNLEGMEPISLKQVQSFPVSGMLPVPTIPPAVSKRISQRFYGPTSPDYSFKAAQRRVQQMEGSDTSPSGQTVSTLDDDQSEDDEETSPSVTGQIANAHLMGHVRSTAPLQFLALFTRHEAMRLIKVYHEAIGELHPICDIDKLLEQMEWLYSWSNGTREEIDPTVDEDTILILNLVLSIALCAEEASKSFAAGALYNSYRDLVVARQSTPAVNVRHVIIAILEGFFHFYMCSPRLAWRMIGLAGRIAMEMGFHSLDVCKKYIQTDRQRAEVAIISCTIVILDRQWSAATGLRPNFQTSDFEMAQASLVNAPYLKAMMAFTLVSDNFNEPIARAARGNMYVDDDGLEVAAFQIKQWRKRALENHNFIHPNEWSDSTPKPPAWTLVLYLRSIAVQGILLRSFFLANPDVTDMKKIKIGLKLVSDSIGVLSILDKTTNIYRLQHPHFQHFLSTSCALLFLIVAYTEHKRAMSSPEFPNDYAETVGSNFEAALKLSAAYRRTFRQSHKLWKRIIAMKEPLIRLSILPNEARREGKAEFSGPAAVTEVPIDQRSQSSEMSLKPSDPGSSSILDPVITDEDWVEFDMQCGPQRSNLMGALPAAIADSDSTMDVLDPLFLDWPMYAAPTQRFFSESTF